MIKMTDQMDQLFNDVISECKSKEPLSHFSVSVRDRLEKYERDVRKEIVSRKENNKCAPLFYACETGKVEMVEYLISTCDADVEQSGWWYPLMEALGTMVSPLWRAAASGQTAIIECLVRHGGQVNAISNWGTTLLQTACTHFHNVKLDVVEYLLKHGADINQADKFGGTCLMKAVHDVKLCELLLKNGANVNARDIEKKTALHYAINKKMLDTVKLLLDYGADVTLRSRDNDDALQTACLVLFRPVIDYLVEHGSYSPGRLADANELMGSCCFRDRPMALKYWRKAIEIRNSNTVDGNPLAKTPSMPKRDCYRNASEFTTLNELNALDSNAFRIQNLLIHERIFGEHKRTFKALRDAGALYAEIFRRYGYSSDHWRYCFDLWRRALEISAAKKSINLTDVARGLVRAMVHSHKRTLEVANRNGDNKEQPRFADVVTIFKLLTNRLVTSWPLHLRSLQRKILIHNHDNGILICMTYLIYLLVKTARTSEAEAEVRALVRHLVKQNPRTVHGATLLHLCVFCENTFKIDPYLRYDGEQSLFPDFEVVKLLLECEADANARNETGMTPLYMASHPRNFSNQELIELLLDHGAHLDTPARSGSTPAREMSAIPDITINLGNYMTLRCHAAQAIVKYKIPCNDLPASVKQFVDLHRQI